MTKRTKKSKKQPTIVVIIALIIAIVTAIQQSRQPATTTTPVATGLVTQILIMTATSVPSTQIPAATVSSNETSVPRSTSLPVATDPPGLELTPMTGTLYDITGTVNALGCPDSRCKVIETYKKNNIIVVTGTVMGTTYKNKDTRIWYQVLSHNGNKVYVHGSYVALHDVGVTN